MPNMNRGRRERRRLGRREQWGRRLANRKSGTWRRPSMASAGRCTLWRHSWRRPPGAAAAARMISSPRPPPHPPRSRLRLLNPTIRSVAPESKQGVSGRRRRRREVATGNQEEEEEGREHLWESAPRMAAEDVERGVSLWMRVNFVRCPVGSSPTRPVRQPEEHPEVVVVVVEVPALTLAEALGSRRLGILLRRRRRRQRQGVTVEVVVWGRGDSSRPATQARW